MKIIKVIYNSESEFILGIVDAVPAKHIIEKYNMDFHKDKKKAREIIPITPIKSVLLFFPMNLKFQFSSDNCCEMPS